MLISHRELKRSATFVTSSSQQTTNQQCVSLLQETAGAAHNPLLRPPSRQSGQGMGTPSKDRPSPHCFGHFVLGTSHLHKSSGYTSAVDCDLILHHVCRPEISNETVISASSSQSSAFVQRTGLFSQNSPTLSEYSSHRKDSLSATTHDRQCQWLEMQSETDNRHLGQHKTLQNTLPKAAQVKLRIHKYSNLSFATISSSKTQ